MAELNVNGKKYKVDVDPETPLLWVIREQVGLTGTKYGCVVFLEVLDHFTKIGDFIRVVANVEVYTFS